jgi:nickel-dependent lactate racemase
MTVLDREQDIYAVTSGSLESAFDEAVRRAAEVFVVQLAQKVDVVIACAKYPMDIDLYQSQKAIENAKLALKPGGTLILVSSCRDGIGDDTFSALLSSCDSPDSVFKKIEERYKLGYHKAAKIAEILDMARVLAYTDLEDKELESVFIKPVNNLQKTLDDLLKEAPGAKVVLMPDASVTVPMAE